MRIQPVLALCLIAATSGPVLAEPPALKTPAPVIFLADNLDEADNLGWCLDTVGRGLSDRLHVHSCKPQGGDVQFAINANGQIESVAFPGKCAEINAASPGTASFELNDCSDAASQRFEHVDATGQIRPVNDPGLCLAAGGQSRQAGPFMSRDLVLGSCDETPERLKTWVVRER